MGLLNESLTVRILGDSSGLQRELSNAARQIESFRQRLSQVTDLSQRLGRAGLSSTEMQDGLAGVADELRGIQGLVGQINGTPLQINVQPALAALQAVSAALEGVAARVLMISLLPNPAPLPGFPAAGPGIVPQSGRRMASGGLVTGASGIDRVPAWLTAGEFVLQRPAVEQLGLQTLMRMNQGQLPVNRVPQRGPVSSTTNSTQVVNEIGGITVNLRDRVDVRDLLDDMRVQSAALRVRRG